MNQNKRIKIIVPVFIVVAIAGIWIFKNTNIEPPTYLGNQSDFVLEATSIDLETLKSHELPIIIDFVADSCFPCKEVLLYIKNLI